MKNVSLSVDGKNAKFMPASPLPIAKAREQAGLSVPELAALIGINEAWCWDLMEYEDELSSTLTLRQILSAASALRISPLSLINEPAAPVEELKSFNELAQRITAFCDERKITLEQFGQVSGWNVECLFTEPATTLDLWGLECLRDVCATLGLHWPDFLHDQHSCA